MAPFTMWHIECNKVMRILQTWWWKTWPTRRTLLSSPLEDLTFSKFFHFQLESSKLILNCNAIWVLIQWLIKQIWEHRHSQVSPLQELESIYLKYLSQLQSSSYPQWYHLKHEIEQDEALMTRWLQIYNAILLLTYFEEEHLGCCTMQWSLLLLQKAIEFQLYFCAHHSCFQAVYRPSTV